MDKTTGSTEETGSTHSSAQDVPLDSVFELLGDQRRRYILHCLQKYANPMALADMADEIAVWENDTSIADISAENVKHIYISLYHTHIPKLAAVDIVEYSQEQDMVALSENADQVKSHMEPYEE